jgi:hypothetical protein
MRITRRDAFEVAWRLAVLALPWQTRWFSEASLVGWPWEQGRWSFYASWAFIAAAVVAGFLLRRQEGRNRANAEAAPKRTRSRRRAVAVGVLLAVTALACGADRLAWTAALQWWLPVSVLALFAWTLVRTGVPRRALAAWFLYSLLPHILLGYWQYAIQKVIGHPWMGMATQLPEDPGVSVIEHGVYRVLRMYGGFPHPNIFAGCTAIGVPLAIWLAATSRTKWRALLWSVKSASLSVAVLLSYARSAWIAVAVGILLLLVLSRRKDPEGRVSRQFLSVALASAILAASVVAIPEYDHLATRFDPTARLEAKSIDARVTSLEVGWDVLRHHPLFGTGPNAELLPVARQLTVPLAAAPLEPPHDAYLLALTDVGIVGFLSLACLLALLIRGVFRSPDRAVPFAILSVLAVLSAFDHYPWSLWAGQSLVAMTVAIGFSRIQAEDDGMPSRTGDP